jgi:nicotinate-nucleotide adenylyltransferase
VSFDLICGDLLRAAQPPARVTLFPGAWDPPTAAHLEIARAARRETGQVVWVLPRAFPHKEWNRTGIAERAALLCAIVQGEPGFSAATTGGGLYREIADEARTFFGPDCEISLACGRDAAERIAGWDYGIPGAFEDLLARYRILAASRAGEYTPDPRHAGRIVSLQVESPLDHISSTEVRRRIAAGEPWEHLVPPSIVAMVRKLYQPQS